MSIYKSSFRLLNKRTRSILKKKGLFINFKALGVKNYLGLHYCMKLFHNLQEIRGWNGPWNVINHMRIFIFFVWKLKRKTYTFLFVKWTFKPIGSTDLISSNIFSFPFILWAMDNGQLIINKNLGMHTGSLISVTCLCTQKIWNGENISLLQTFE